MSHRILLVEDEISIAEGLKFNLEKEGYTVAWVTHGHKAIDKYEKERFDLVILDIMLPGASGYEVCTAIRIKDETTPILFLSAKYQDAEKIKALKSGADDYMTKPFNLEELILRIKRLLRRSDALQQAGKTIPSVYRFGNNQIDFNSYMAITREGEIVLTPKEADIMKLLIQNDGQVVSREAILASIWGYDVYPTTRTIDNFIARLRKYFDDDPKNARYIHSIRGVGYKFISDEK